MADQIKVSFGALDAAVGDITAGVSAQGVRLEELSAAIAPMVATWSGSAQAAYHGEQLKWNAAWDELTSALGQLRAATDTANSGYQAGESANAASWG